MKPNIKFIIFSAIIVLIINIFIGYEIYISDRIYEYGQENDTEVESIDFTEVKEGFELTQEFVGKYDNLNRITINFSNIFYDSKTASQSMLVGIRNIESGKIISEQEVLLNHIRVEKGYKFEFEKQEDSKGKIVGELVTNEEGEVISKDLPIGNYTLVEVEAPKGYELLKEKINVKCNKLNVDEPIYTVKYYDTDIYEETNMKVNGKNTKFDLDFQDAYINKGKLTCLYAVMVSLDIIMFVIAYSIYTDKKISTEKVFLKVIPVFAILLCLSITMGNGKDESSHLYRAYEISEGTFVTKIIQGSAITRIPETIKDIPYCRMGTYEELLDMFKKSIDGEKVYMIINSSAVYSPIQYIPHATGILFAKLFTNDSLIITYAGRIGIIIACIAILYLAIKTAPFGKNVFLVLSMLPITVAGIATLSADGLTTSVCFLFIAYILKLAFDSNKKIRKRDLILLGILTVFISLCKIVYLPLIGLLLIIPKEKWGGKTDKSVKIATLWLLGICASLIWLSIASGVLSIDRNGDSIIKLGLILENPFRYIQTILHTIFYQLEVYINSMFGGDIEYDSVLIFPLIPYILMFLTIAVTFMDEKIKKIQISTFQKIIIVLVCLAIVFLTFTSLYLQWTEYGLDYVKGVQGRYFIPFLPLVFILLGRIKFKGEYTEESATKLVGIVGAIMQICVVMLIMLQHI